MAEGGRVANPARRWVWIWHWILVIAIAGPAFGAVAWRLDRAPDIFTDEILYTRAGIRVAAEGALVWDNGEPIFVHPPLYFLIEGAYLRLTTNPASVAQVPGDIFTWVYHARYLNALFAGLTAATLYLLGRRLRGPWLGLILAALFILDPFGVRINRRAMLETLAMLLTLIGMAILLTSGKRPRPARAMVSGLLLGAGLLTKELTFTAPLAVLIFALWEYRRGQRTAIVAVAIAGLTYLFFPLWAATTGRWDRFVHVKALSLSRLLGLVQLSGWNRPGVSLLDFLVRRLVDYGSSYLLLALGGVATLWLLMVERHHRTGRLLGIWGLVLYTFYAFTTLVGTGNDQFFYFLLVPAMLMAGYAATGQPLRLAAVVGRPTVVVQRSAVGGRPSAVRKAVGLFLAALLLYNAVRWWTAYGVGVDDGYHQLATYVRAHLPPGEPLNASGDAIKFKYFFPHRPISDAATPEEARARGVHYFVLAPKDVWARYGRVTPELAGWIAAQGKLLLAVDGDSYGEIFLYYVDYEDGSTAPGMDHPYSRWFPPAQTGFVNGLLLALGLWYGGVSGLAGWFSRRRMALSLQTVEANRGYT